jgi:parallel beta-helix repeat protein
MLRLVSKLFGHRPTAKSLNRSRRRSLRLETLEDRSVPAVLFVDPSNLAIGGAFPTITDAVNAAHPGDLIKVAPGTYHEGVDVTKAGVTLLGGQVRIPGLEKAGPSIIISNPAVTGFALDANNITIESFTITQEADGIRTNGSFSGYRILNNTFLDDGVGVHLNTLLTAAAATTTISGNKFTSDGNGVVTRDAMLVDGAGVRNVVVSNNFFVSGRELDSSITVDGSSVSTNLQIVSNHFTNDGGMILDNLTGAKIDSNLIVNPTSTAVELAGGVSKSEVARNTILDSQSTPPAGIVLDNELVATIDTGNSILANSISGMSAGIALRPASQTTITGNTVAFSTGDGIAFDVVAVGNTVLNCTGNTLTGNIVVGSTGNGIRLSLNSASAGNTLTHNVVNHNQGDGMQVSATGATLTGNIAEFNGGDGIRVAGDHNVLTSNTTAFNLDGTSIRGSFNRLTGNLAEQNAGDGFFLDGASNTQLSSNTARANLKDGFATTNGEFASDANVYDRNVAVTNGEDGFDLTGGVDAPFNTIVLTNNTASRNAVDGFVVFRFAASRIANNTASANGAGGLAFFQLNGTVVSGNTVSGNDGDGIALGDDCIGCTVSSNRSLNNIGDGIDVDSSSTGNQITTNIATGNGLAAGGFDLFDGSGTTTQNTWSKNTANTRNPAGLG